jgi:hypothetical protein
MSLGSAITGVFRRPYRSVSAAQAATLAADGAILLDANRTNGRPGMLRGPGTSR